MQKRITLNDYDISVIKELAQNTIEEYITGTTDSPTKGNVAEHLKLLSQKGYYENTLGYVYSKDFKGTLVYKALYLLNELNGG